MYEKVHLHGALDYSEVHIPELEGTDRSTSWKGNDQQCSEIY